MAKYRQTRFNNIGLQGALGQKDSQTNSVNTQDTFIRTFEVPLRAVASSSAQTTVVETGNLSIQVISAYIRVITPETVGTTKTLTMGIGPGASNVLSATSAAVAGCFGSPASAPPVTNLTPSTNKFNYTLGSADWSDFVGVAIITAICANA
jgi:hypothetical protein